MLILPSLSEVFQLRNLTKIDTPSILGLLTTCEMGEALRNMKQKYF